MGNMKYIDIDTWNRKEHFEFFSQMDNPFFGVVSEIDCTRAHAYSKEQGISFFAHYLYQSVRAVNLVEAMKLRVAGKKVILYDVIHASATIGRKDGTFGFSFMESASDFDSFNAALMAERKSVEESSGLRNSSNAQRTDVIHYSTLPWSKFTGLTHARSFNTSDTVPKITFGKIFSREGNKYLPISVDVHHGLVDGLHIAQFMDAFQRLMDEN